MRRIYLSCALLSLPAGCSGDDGGSSTGASAGTDTSATSITASGTGTASATDSAGTDSSSAGTDSSGSGGTSAGSTSAGTGPTSGGSSGGSTGGTTGGTSAGTSGGSTGGSSGGSTSGGSTGGVSATSGGTGNQCANDETVCDGIDDDCNGLVDDVDAGNDGLCDCLNIGILGNVGYSPASEFDNWLTAQGTLVERTLLDNVNDVVDAAFLQKYDVVIVERLPRALTNAEAAALHDFVNQDGNGLMTLIGYNFDNNNPVPERDKANTALAPFDLAYSGGYVFAFDETIYFVGGHPLTNNVTSFSYKGGIEVVELQAGNHTVIATVDNGKTGAIASENGSGKVLAFGDEWLTFDSEWQAYPDVEPFWANTLAWLSPDNFCLPPPQ